MTPNLRGAAFMIAAMIAFAIEDAVLKQAFTTIPKGAAFTGFGLVAGLLCAAWSLKTREPILPKQAFSPGLLTRAGIEITGRLFYTLSLAFVSLSLTSVILQATPLVVTLGAALFLGERVGPRRWIAMSIGFLGVLLILRPTPGQFDPLVILPVIGMLGFAGRDLATRASPPEVSVAQLGTMGFIAVTLAGLIIWAFDPRPPTGAPLSSWALVAVAGGVGALAYNALTIAMRTGDVAVVAPFRYSRLLVALAIALMFFGETPAPLTYLGAALIVASGLYTLLRGARAPVSRSKPPPRDG